MTSKQTAIIIVLAILTVGSAIFFFTKSKSVTQDTPENFTNEISPTPSSAPTPATLSTWNDEAGFSFQYPQGTKFNKHPEDTLNYANLSLILPSSDTVNILMADNTFKDLTAWVGKNSAIDTTLGGKPAKKITVDGQVTVACIDNEVLVTITGKDISTIINSWEFVYPTPTTGAVKKSIPATDDGGDVLEEE